MEKKKNKKVVLVVDDDAAIAESIEMILQLHDYEVFVSYGNDVIKKVSDHHPDMILLDKWMSGIDGTDICRELKDKKDTSHIPIVMISASNDIKNTSKAGGADDYLPKPFEMQALLEKVEKFLNQ